MKRLCLLCVLLAVACVGASDSVRAADLTEVDRAIGKQPAYRTKTPRFGLLVFGPKAETRVWLVVDGDTLYVDRNANSDLTEAGERIKGKLADGRYEFKIDELHDGKLTHSNLRVVVEDLARTAEWLAAVSDPPGLRDLLERDPQAKAYSLGLDVEVPGQIGDRAGGRVRQKVNNHDKQGMLQFAEDPRSAPVIHFRGPWVIATYGKQTIVRDGDGELTLCFGTPGLGAGTFVYTCYHELVPETACPVVDITFPAKSPGQMPPTARYTLKRRC